MPEDVNTQPPWADGEIPANIRQTAQALGFVVIGWGQLEGAVNTAVIKLLKTLPLHFEIVGHIDFRAKLQIIKSVAFVSMKNDKWFKDMEEIINIMDNDLRVARNRMIHDMWYLPFESIES